jgi:hypothetical protein
LTHVFWINANWSSMLVWQQKKRSPRSDASCSGVAPVAGRGSPYGMPRRIILRRCVTAIESGFPALGLAFRGLAVLMDPGDHHHRVHVGIHAFDVDGQICLTSAYLEEVGDQYRYRYAVLCGGEAAKKAPKTARLNPGDSDEPSPHRRIALASYEDYEEFVERLPRYLNDVIRDLEARVERSKAIETTNQRVGAEIRASAKRFGKKATQDR